MSMSPLRLRIAGFVAASLVSVAGGTAYLVHASQRDTNVAAGTVAAAAAAPTVASVQSEPHVVFRNLEAASGAGRAAVVALDAIDGPRTVLDQECLRVSFAGGQGVCLKDGGDLFDPYDIVFLGPDLEPRHQESLGGLISRARVSPDGRYGAATVFVTGHSYAEGGFSTQTTVYEVATGTLLGDLEHYRVFKDGQRISSPDFNVWGVTFANQPGLFYATLATGDHTYLVRGDLERERLDVLRDGVECPSLSPDNTRIAFKERVDGGSGDVHWRPAVLDLDTLADRPLPETRNVDDQIAWLDDSTVLYAVDTGEGSPDTWSLAADGSGGPRLFLENADSPAVVRP